MSDSGWVGEIDVKKSYCGARKDKLWINTKRMKNDFQMRSWWCCNVEGKGKNTFSAPYLQMFAEVIEQVNFLSASFIYQLFTSTHRGYLTFIGRRAMYWLSWCDFWLLLTTKNFLTVWWKALSVWHVGAALFTEHLSSLKAFGLNFIIGRKLQTA